MAETNAVYLIKPSGNEDAKKVLGEIAAELEAGLGNTPGFGGVNLAVYDHEALDWAVVITFDTVEGVGAWRTSPEHQRFTQRLIEVGLADGSTSSAAGPKMVELEPGGKPPAGCAVIAHHVKTHLAEAFIDYETAYLLAPASKFPGFVGATLLPSATDRDMWTTLLQFGNDEQLQAWLESDVRRQNLPGLRDLLAEDFETATSRSPFGAVVRMVGGKPLTSPSWKIVMLVVLVLFPTVSILLSFWNPLMTFLSVPPGVGSLASQLIATSLVTALWMPFVSRIFSWWIDPVDGAGDRKSIGGAAIVVGLYAAEILFFALFPVLTPWG